MIQPADISRKAENLYEAVLRSWLDGSNSFFPRTLPVNKQLDQDLAKAIKEISDLKQSSKEVLGYGYSVNWREKSSRKHGRNLFPDQISFETLDDYLKFIHKKADFDSFTTTVKQIRCNFPQLESWLQSNIRCLSTLAPDINNLLAVVKFFQENPRPNCFVRELPLEVDTKFIERNKSVLWQWLDIVLPSHSIRADEDHFERRFGLRYSEPHLMLRFLDLEMQKETGFPCDVLSLPLDTLAHLQFNKTKVIIVENKVNLLTLPHISCSIALGALGRAVSLLRYIRFLSKAQIIYWGDLDVEGFEILSTLRVIFPQSKSILMDKETLLKWRHLAVKGTGRELSIPANLTHDEKEAFSLCLADNLRIEQERIPQNDILNAIKYRITSHNLLL